MLKLFDRYILKEILPPFLIGITAYTFVLLMNQILLLSEMFIARGVPAETVLSLLLYLVPSILAFTIPMSVLMGVLAGLSRLSSDVEITAFRTLGIGQGHILKPVLIFSICGWLVTSFFSLYLAPHANYKWIKTLSQSVKAEAQFSINPREFYDRVPQTAIFIQDIGDNGLWENIFVHFSQPRKEPRIIFAEKGKMNLFPEKKRATLELQNGIIHSYHISKPENYSMTSFKKLEEELNVQNLFAGITAEKRAREKDIKELLVDIKKTKHDLKRLFHSDTDSMEFKQNKRALTKYQVEAHKKFALPFACIIFSFLGISLGVSTKKGGRTSGFTLSIVIIVVYYILITAGENLSVNGSLVPWLGMWGPNLLLAALSVGAFIYSRRESGVMKSLTDFFPKKSRSEVKKKKSRMGSAATRIPIRFPNIMDRYISKKYLAIFLLVFVSLICVFIIITFFESIDNVYEHGKSLNLFYTYLWYRLPEFIHYVLPVAALSSALLCLGILTKFNEVTAMKTSGMSVFRIIVPVLILSALISLFSFYIQEYVLPFSSKKAEVTWNEINDIPPRSTNRLDRRWIMSSDGNRMYHYTYFDQDRSVFKGLTILDLNVNQWTLNRRIYAEKARLNGKTLILNDLWQREFQQKRPVHFRQQDELKMRIDEDKGHFVKGMKKASQMHYNELKEYIYKLEESHFQTSRYKVDLHNKISFPLASFVVVLLGIPFAFSMGKRGTLVGIGISFIIAIIYWGAIGIFKSLGYAGYMSPFFGAWGPNLIFGLLGIYLILNLRT
ncbi:MAG: LPS export ABC transporter permease LptG [Candidatus Aminicenantes bacterium]|nr:LPS export ABC transporter permease LptG [Candidatus Aminicenantes bacterium]